MKKNNIKRFFAVALKRKRSLILAMATGVIRYIIPLAVPIGIRIIVDKYLTEKAPEAVSSVNGVMIILIVLYVFYAVASYFRSYFIGTFGNRLIFDLQKRLYEHIQKMSLNYFDQNKTGEIVSRMTMDITAAQNLVSMAVVNTFMDVIFIAVIMVVLLLTNVRLALISFAVFPLYFILGKGLSVRLRKIIRDVRQKASVISGGLHEEFSAISTIQAFTQEDMMREQFLRNNRSYYQSLRLNLKMQSMALGLTGFFTAVGPLLVLWAGALEVIGGDLTVGELMAFYAYVGLLYQPTQRLAELRMTIDNSLVAIDRIYEVFDTYPNISNKVDAKEMNVPEGGIQFDDVSFAYPGSENLFNGLSFNILPGTTVALVGASGGGKSSIASLLLRVYDVNGGSIKIDGEDIRQVTMKSLRKNISFVAQSPILLNGTIEDNLRYGKPNATMEEIEEAAKKAYADIFIKKFPKGYQTEVGERGTKLSGGERQRITIARAYLKNAPILILDEPTAALDPESEDLFKKALAGLVKGHTTLIISHRLTTIDFASRILVIERGKIVEDGTHSELVSKENGLYRRYSGKI
ncbi:MAG: ABC transporter ATP-binding protein [Candidatus Omnitrophica bacterium]|nr:ABC transporter ATP-binding protein [Candidatus Omnitrophota bacterium]